MLAGACVWLFVVALGCAVVAYRFYRDPERTPPDGLGAVVSPADGTIVYIRTVHGEATRRDQARAVLSAGRADEDPLHLGEARVIGIGLNFMDVHVNRAPVAGSVTCERHRGPVRLSPPAGDGAQNERVTMVFEGGGGQIAVVLIASRLVRRIVTFVHDGEDVAVRPANRHDPIRLSGRRRHPGDGSALGVPRGRVRVVAGGRSWRCSSEDAYCSSRLHGVRIAPKQGQSEPRDEQPVSCAHQADPFGVGLVTRPAVARTGPCSR